MEIVNRNIWWINRNIHGNINGNIRNIWQKYLIEILVMSVDKVDTQWFYICENIDRNICGNRNENI